LSQQKSLAPCDGCSRGRVVALAFMKELWRKATIGSHSSRQCDHFVGAAPAAICHKQTPLPLIFSRNKNSFSKSSKRLRTTADCCAAGLQSGLGPVGVKLRHGSKSAPLPIFAN